VDEQHPRLDMIRVLNPIDADGDLGHATPLRAGLIPEANLGLPGSFAPVPNGVSI
jgi:hypothetical protein